MAVHRFAAPHTVESVVSLVDVPNEEMKGRIIGREGRNIRAFERETGVDVIIDDTPGTISLSAFDGVRREIARRAMERLIADGRIHPARIEEIVENVKREMENEIGKIGKQFLAEQDIHNVHPKLITLLGRLQFRTSYGQNVLQHIREVAHVCSVMAAELGLDAKLARRCGVFHDIGKAVDHTFEGSHPQIGGDLLKRFGEGSEVIEAAEHHHSDPTTVKHIMTVLAAAADAVSASRPGARGETVENYMRRVEKLEAIAKSFPGVTQAFAVYAGRELRIIVSAEQVNDDQAVVLARDVAKAIEEQLTYPGEIKVTVMRERRIIEYAR
jgi:ribonuclease Y